MKYEYSLKFNAPKLRETNRLNVDYNNIEKFLLPELQLIKYGGSIRFNESLNELNLEKLEMITIGCCGDFSIRENNLTLSN